MLNLLPDMFRINLKNRYSIAAAFALFFLATSFIVRTILLVMALPKAGLNLSGIIRIYATGFFFDAGVVLLFLIPYFLYLLLLPQKLNKTLFNKIVTIFFFFLATLIVMFAFFAEITFWQEFESRFNFIAVDYLIYTYEVINNINESYPLPILISSMLLISVVVTWFMFRTKMVKTGFASDSPFRLRFAITGSGLLLAAFYTFIVHNSWAETSNNHYQNELSKAGIYSFFSAFRNNELNYDQFYAKITNQEAFQVVRNEIRNQNTSFNQDGPSIRRLISGTGNTETPNVILVTIESFSASFMERFGNTQKLTPVLDSLAGSGVLFSNLYATGTRTVRGMEALSLAVPPTPGSSIVRRPDNKQLFSVASIFKKAGYGSSFFYGGDGYFDNMNQFFGSNGFDVTDRGRKIIPGDAFAGKRTIIPDSLVHFENAWGICDEDLYDAVIRDADNKLASGKKFFDFVMTTSNHRPFTYPDGKVDLPSGSGREGAVKYTDYAIGQFLKKIKNKPWYNNTVIIFVADHCASSAGKNEIDIANYHIPCMIVNLKNQPALDITPMCSQIDIFPTLFSLLNWNYESNLYGENVLDSSYTPRALLGTYQKLGYLKQDSFVVLSPRQQIAYYRYDKTSNTQIPVQEKHELGKEAIAQYQTAYYLFKNNGMRE